MTNTAKNQCNSYHHGNLHDALIIAAAELIEEKGSLDFAMIDAARKAGVSSAAPYRHYKDKDELLQAVCHLAFMSLTEAVEAAAEQHPDGSREQVIALGQSYVRFVLEHPDFYDLMFGKTAARSMESDDVDLTNSGFYTIANSVKNWCEATGTGGNDPVDLAVKLWAMVHGLAGLARTEHVDKFMPGVDVYALVESTTHTFLGGLEQKQ